MSLILKSFYTLKLKKKNIVEICKLKDKEWKYGLKSQIKLPDPEQEYESEFGVRGWFNYITKDLVEPSFITSYYQNSQSQVDTI